ncbi:MFS transporter [Thermoplasma sp.]|uniref:MFS transporter n=1 Tax=Thermoplasma sp. TaxID=1973142 RepID=UPI00128A55EE|nr:MFS transporter [Thermoplasma sp.]KAA8922174.1 MAG: MFS transporter [Thermoplasma sp.]
MADKANPIELLDDARLTGTHVSWTLIASLGDFLDAGMFAGTGITLSAILAYLHITSTLLAGFPALVTLLCTAFGALIFGPLGDRYGRKFIYQVDMIIYAVAAILLAFSFNFIWAMVFYALIGISVGADVPTSWSLISEFAPKAGRGKLMTYTNIMWYVGVLVELAIAIAIYNTGITLFRTIWIMLGVIAIVAWALRRKLTESPRFDVLKGRYEDLHSATKVLGTSQESEVSISKAPKYKEYRYGELFTKYGGPLLFAWFLYLMWGIPASTYGEFFPYIFSSLHLVSTRIVFAFEAIYFGSAIVPGLLIYYFLTDKVGVGRYPLYLTSAAMSAVSFLLLVYKPFLYNVPVLLISFLLFGIGQGLGVWPITRLYSLEHFPTSLRNSGQGFVWFTMRFEGAIFGLFTPLIVKASVTYIGWIAGIFFLLALIVVGIMGFAAPSYVRTESRSLDQTAEE